MASVLYTVSKYLIIILFACFVCVSFNVQRERPMASLKKGYNRQRALLIIIHALAFLSLLVKIRDGSASDTTALKAFAFYICQLAYIIFVSCILPRILPMSRGLNNCMVMFLTVGIIIQTRLGFDAAVRQGLLIAAGTILYIAFSVIIKKVNFARNLKWVYCFAGVALLILVLILSTASGGAKTYLDLGFITFQPLEFVKILFVLFVAAFFYRDNSFRTVLITGIFAAVHVLILVACNDLGGALILAVLYVLMAYAAKKDWKILVIGLFGFALAAVCAYMLFSHVQVRVEAWLDPFSDVSGKGYQIAQSLFAIGTGGWFGLGLYGGLPKTIPEVTNDMVFAAIAEELGVFFAIMLILLWLCFILMIVRVSLRVSNIFYKLVCFGMGLAFGVQVFLNIGGSIKFIPLTGVNLPFISSGGSSVFASMIMIGMVQALYVISEVDVELEKEAAQIGLRSGASDDEDSDFYLKQALRPRAGEGKDCVKDYYNEKYSGKAVWTDPDDINEYDYAGYGGFEEEAIEAQLARKVREVSEENRMNRERERNFQEYAGRFRDGDEINIIGLDEDNGRAQPSEQEITAAGSGKTDGKVKQIDPEDL